MAYSGLYTTPYFFLSTSLLGCAKLYLSNDIFFFLWMDDCVGNNVYEWKIGPAGPYNNVMISVWWKNALINYKLKVCFSPLNFFLFNHLNATLACTILFYLMPSGSVNIRWVFILGNQRFSFSLHTFVTYCRSPGHSQPKNDSLD